MTKYFLLICFACFLFYGVLYGQRVLPAESITYLRVLNKEKFDQRFPGEIHSDPQTISDGWYVRYQHEKLVYLFGPNSSKAATDFYADELRDIFQDALIQRERLATATIFTVEYPLKDPVPDGRGTGNKPNSDRSADDQPTGDPSQTPAPPEPQRNAFLEWLFSIFS